MSTGMTQVAERYARALEAKIDDENAPQVLRDLAVLQKWCDDLKEFRNFIRNPLISREDMAKCVEKIALKAKFHPLTTGFLNLLARKRRLSLLPQTISQITTLHDQKQGIIKAIITSAQKLASPEIKNIQKFLTSKLKKTPKLIKIIDPKVLGGFSVKVGPYLMDATIKTQLIRIQMLLKEV